MYIGRHCASFAYYVYLVNCCCVSLVELTRHPVSVIKRTQQLIIITANSTAINLGYSHFFVFCCRLGKPTDLMVSTANRNYTSRSLPLYHGAVAIASIVPLSTPLAWPCCTTSLNPEFFCWALSSYPDPTFVGFIYDSLCQGFCINFNYHDAGTYVTEK